jgi:predicted SAM-dependent methyltransferase
LGSADNRLPGWINIDLMRPGRRLDLYWDLRRGIPFPDGSVDAVFAEHLLEHLDLSAGISLLRKCRRVLRPGAQVRIGVPDLDRYLASYLGQDDLIERVRAGRPTRAVALGEVFFLHGHRSMSDFETLSWAFREAGFAHIERFEFGVGRTGPAPDSERRRTETLYVEGWFDAPEPETSA